MPGLTPEALEMPPDDDAPLAFPTDDDDAPLAFPTDDDDDDGGLAFPTDDDDDDGGLAFPTDDEDDGIAFPTDDDEEAELLPAPPLAAPSPPKAAPPPPKAAPPPLKPPPIGGRGAPKPPPVGARAAPKPPPIGAPRAPGAPPVAPPPIGGRPQVAPPPAAGRPQIAPPPGGGRPQIAPPPAAARPPGRPPGAPPGRPGAPPAAARPPGAPPSSGQLPGNVPRTGTPPPPTTDPFASGVFSGDSGVLSGDSGVLAGDSAVMEASASASVSKSGVFDVDPFFTGNPEQMPELGSITHGDANEFKEEDPAGVSGIREFEFEGGEGGSLELGELGDLSEGARAPKSALSKPNFDSPDFAVLDLPAPADTAELGSGRTPELELTPSSGGDLSLDLPAPSGGTPDLDLPAPASDAADLSLPMPMSSGSTSDLDLPAPSMDLALDDLPMPADDLPMPAADLPAPMDDFPGGAIDDFPAPDIDIDALPTPADSLPVAADSLPTPADSLPVAADSLPAPADVLPTPIDELNLDLDNPADFSTSEGAVSEASAEDSEATKPSPVGRRKEPKHVRTGSPTPKGEKRNIGRLAIYAALAIAVVGGGVFAAVQAGLIGGNDPGGDPISEGSGGDESGQGQTPGELTERPENVLAKFDQDTPASYVQAYTLSENDPIGRAEAALLLHLRYGPDPARLAEAGAILADHQGATEVHIRRVVGLAKLSQGDTEAALSLLEGDDPRASLYRAWALLDKELVDKARGAAEAAVAGRKNDQAAALAVMEARFAANPEDGLAAMRQATERSGNHLALQETLMRAAQEQGLLGEAAQIGQKLQPSSVSDTHKAEILRQRAEVAMAQGRTGEAMRLLEQALASDAKLLQARLDRIDLWLFNKDLSSARADLELLLRDYPSDPQVLKMGARADLEAGRDGDARARIQSLGEGGATDPEALDLLGEADALLMKVDIARTSYAKAREVDPYYIPAVEHEVSLLLKAQMAEQALELLNERTTAMTEAGAKAQPRGRKALAAVAFARATVLRDKGELGAALAATEEAISDDPANNDARLLRAALLSDLDRQGAHEEALLELHERTGGYPGLTEPLGQVLLRKGQLDELEALIGGSLEAPSASREIILTGAALRLAQQRHQDAEVLASKVLERDPTDSRAHLLRGRALLGLGDYTRALDEIQSAQTREGNAEVELWLGQALEYNSRAVDALSHYKKALELDPKNNEAAALLGRLYAYQGAAIKAIDILEPVLRDNADAFPYAHLALGLAHKDMGKRKQAIDDFQRAQALDPSLFEAYYEEGRIHNDQNKHKLAVKALQAGLDNAKDNATERALIDTYRRLGESNKQIGRRADARVAFEEYLRLAPVDAAGRAEVERLLRDL